MNFAQLNATSDVKNAEIEAALKRVLASNQFVRAERLSRFLAHVIGETLAGREDRLGGYAIGLDVFDRPEDFDPSADTIVRVEARRLRQTLKTYYLEGGADDPIEISIPKGSYTPVFRTRDITIKSAPPFKPANARRGPVVAVLPFDNFSPGPAEGFFANGLTEQLIASLARFRDLSVVSRHSVARFSGEKFDLAAIRGELGADYFFEGSIRKSDKKVRVTAQMIDAAEDVHLWADTFEHALSAADLFDIQDNIAETLAARIADRYGPLGRVGGAGGSSRTGSLDAYAAVLRFYDNYAQHHPGTHAEARAALNGAIAVDPDYADAWAALAAIHLDEFRFGFNALEGEPPALERATNAALHAVLLDPENVMGHQFLACAYFHAGDDAGFRITAERALDLHPGHADALADLGTCYWMLGDYALGEQLVARAMELSPTRPGWYHTVPMAKALLAGEKEATLREALQAYIPGFHWSSVWKAAALARLERWGDAQQELTLLEDIYPNFGQHYFTEARKWRCSEALIEALAEGLCLAGLEITDLAASP